MKISRNFDLDKHNTVLMRFKMKTCSFLPLLIVLTLLATTTSGNGGTLLVGNTVTRNDVTSFASITKDLRDMEADCIASNLSGARQIYEDGKNSEHSLRYLATHDGHLERDMTFGFQMYGLSGGRVGDAAKHRLFASEYVEKLFDQDDCFGALRAARTIVMWMHASYELWNIVTSCEIHADPAYDNEVAGVDNLPEKADRFAAYWIGALQVDGGPGGMEGYSLYSSTNEMGSIYDEQFNESQLFVAPVNKNILEGYEAISAILSRNDACANQYSRSIESIWPIVTAMSKQMLIPLLQWLIYSMLEDEIIDIEIYSKLLIPQLSQCRPSSYKYLKLNLLDRPYDSSKLHETLKVLHSVFPCLGVFCSDIGHPDGHDETSLLCSTYYVTEPVLAGYPTSSDVLEESKIDLDMHQINILTQFDNDVYWDLARSIYKNGRNSRSRYSDPKSDDDGIVNDQLLSLHSLATDGSRQEAMYYSDFITFFDDPFYADNMILDAFDNRERWKGSPRTQRAAVIRVTMQVHIMYMVILTKLNDAVKTCASVLDSDASTINLISWSDNIDDIRATYYNSDILSAWDEAAAFIVGSLEGERNGGSKDFEDGQSLWNLANNRCIEFGRQNDNGYAISNNLLFGFIAAGKNMITSGNCFNLERVATDISNLLLVPVIQSVIKYAIQNQSEMRSSTKVEIALGEAFASGVTPVVLNHDKESGIILMNNMIPIDSSGELVVDGPQAVADTFLAISHLDCNLVGKSFDVDACLNHVHITSGTVITGILGTPTTQRIILSMLSVAGTLYLTL